MNWNVSIRSVVAGLISVAAATDVAAAEDKASPRSTTILTSGTIVSEKLAKSWADDSSP